MHVVPPAHGNHRSVCCWLQDCLEMAGIGSELRGLPQGTDLIQGPRVQRQVSRTVFPAEHFCIFTEEHP